MSSINSRVFAVQLLFFILIIFSSVATAGETIYTFQQLLDDAGLVLNEPEGFISKEPEKNPVLSYEHALQHRQKKTGSQVCDQADFHGADRLRRSA